MLAVHPVADGRHSDLKVMSHRLAAFLSSTSLIGGQTCQGTLADVVSKVFKIKTGFQGSIISQFARMNLENVVDDLNEDILQPWADMLEEKGSNVTPDSVLGERSC